MSRQENNYNRKCKCVENGRARRIVSPRETVGLIFNLLQCIQRVMTIVWTSSGRTSPAIATGCECDSHGDMIPLRWGGDLAHGFIQPSNFASVSVIILGRSFHNCTCTRRNSRSEFVIDRLVFAGK